MPFGTTKEVVPKGMISGTPTTLQRIAASVLVQNTSISFPLLQTYLHAAQMRSKHMHFRGGKVLARVHSHDDRFVYKHTVRNPKRYGVACEGIMSDENDRFLTELCKLRARTRSKRFYRERCPGKCNAAK